jgi:hypothetical protein
MKWNDKYSQKNYKFADALLMALLYFAGQGFMEFDESEPIFIYEECS